MQEGQAAYYPPLSSSLSSTHPSNLVVDTIQGRSLAAPSGDISNCTCSNGSHFDRSGTCSSNSSITATSNQLTPPEHVLTSCPSSSFSASTAASGSSPTLYPDFLYPPHPSQSVLSLSNSGSVISIGNCAPYHFQHHLPKSLSRSSISSNGSTLLFSPSLEAQNLQNYSPLTPPLPLPLEDTSNKGKSLAPQTVVKPSRSAKLSLDLPKSSSTSQVPILPKMEGTNEPSTSRTSSKSSMLVVTPACISQLATYLAEMIVYLWFSPPQKRAPTFPKPTSAFARFCNDILTTSACFLHTVAIVLIIFTPS